MQRIFTTLLLCLFVLNAGAQPAPEERSFIDRIRWIWSDEPPAKSRGESLERQEEAQALLEKGIALFERESYFRASRTFKKIAKKYKRTKAAGEALYYRGTIYMIKGRWTKAFDQFQMIVKEHPKFEDFDRVIGNQFQCATALMEGARGKIFGVIPGFRQYSEATLQFARIVQNAPYGDYAPLALMNLAFVSEMRENPEDAIDAYDRLINFYPQSMLAPDAYYNLARTYSELVSGEEYDQGSTRQAISYYEDFLILYPRNEFIGEVEANLKEMENLLASSRLNLGDFYYFYRANNTAALTFYNEAITTAPNSDAASQARARIKDIEAGVKPTTSANFVAKLLGAN